MSISIEGYYFGKVKKIEGAGDQLIRLTILTEDTKKDLIITMKYRNISIGNEIEVLINDKDILLARHNITKNIKEKYNSKIQFPTEVLFDKTEKEWDDFILQKIHILLGDIGWMQEIYDKYIYLSRIGASMRGARDPYNPKNFKDTKSYIANARNICFFYCIAKAKNGILTEFQKGDLDEILFKSFITEYYMVFLDLTKRLPLSYQTAKEFEQHFAEIKYQVGL